jgi:hypothetical protein
LSGDLQFSMMIGGENQGKEACSAGTAEKEFLSMMM